MMSVALNLELGFKLEKLPVPFSPKTQSIHGLFPLEMDDDIIVGSEKDACPLFLTPPVPTLAETPPPPPPPQPGIGQALVPPPPDKPRSH